jgi:hypothetical protein
VQQHYPLVSPRAPAASGWHADHSRLGAQEFDTATIFNATSRVMGCKEGDFQKWYTDQTIKHLTPDLVCT